MFENKRESMIEEIKGMGIKDGKVLKALEEIHRHLFVPKDFINQAYLDMPLSIGYNQTISQPYTVAFMLENLELKKGDKVLEIGTGSGYNAALIAHIVKPGIVYTTEIIPELVEFAKKNINKTKLKNIKVIHGDGSIGYKKAAPFNAIIVTAGSPEIPKPLLQQLKVNGILVAPVGGSFGQEMIKIKKSSKDKFRRENLGSFVFVKLRGKHGWH